MTMGKRDIIHLILGKDEDIGPKTKTGCGRLLEDCGSGVVYRYRAAISCPECLVKAQAIAKMRGEKLP